MNTQRNIRSVCFTVEPELHTKLRETAKSEFMSAGSFAKKATLRLLAETVRKNKNRKHRKVSK